jgi:hypothetical protein
MDILNDIIDILIDRFVNSIYSRDKAECYYDRLQVIINILDKINRKLNTKFKLKKRSKRAKRVSNASERSERCGANDAKSNKPKLTLAMLRSHADTLPINNEILINNDGTSNSNDESSNSNDESSNSNDESSSLCSSANAAVTIDESPYYCHIL